MQTKARADSNAIDAIDTFEGRQRLATLEQFKELRENVTG
jgi:hypothetical protein